MAHKISTCAATDKTTGINLAGTLTRNPFFKRPIRLRAQFHGREINRHNESARGDYRLKNFHPLLPVCGEMKTAERQLLRARHFPQTCAHAIESLRASNSTFNVPAPPGNLRIAFRSHYT